MRTKGRLALTVDYDVLKALEQLPRKLSISEVITWIVRAALQDIKAGRELSAKELQEWIDSTPEGKDFRRRLQEQWGPTFGKIDNAVEMVKKAVKPKRK
ncbi:hypothetical protein JZK55_22760 [Dissulfurispira thermophila]|uniref:Uncharacterized protein n=2 Tax=root TaxID=1 RepID=A0A7G1H3G0_9BACT|nr:hypothetical protein [Dissulfurispira thermophila]BCB97354.1 hypothetical protein JZK55_22760 [Dissulfurispira thermophila]